MEVKDAEWGSPLRTFNFRLKTAAAYQNGVHPHVDSAYTDQDTPAESHTEAQEERIL